MRGRDVTNAINRKLTASIAASLALALGACGSSNMENRTLYSVKQPVVERSNFVLDVNTNADGLPVADQQRLSEIEDLARRINAVLTPLFAQIDLTLVDFKLELGLNSAGDLLLADEISPDTCRLWDRQKTDQSDRILDKDRFRKDLGGVMEAYGEVLKRVQGVCPDPRYCL